MKKLLCETLMFPKWSLLLWVFFLVGLGLWLGWQINASQSSSAPSASSVVETPRINTGGNAIANFGVVPINPDWLVLTHKSGQPIESTPSHEWALLTSAYEPRVEKIPGAHEYDRPTWRITFE